MLDFLLELVVEGTIDFVFLWPIEKAAEAADKRSTRRKPKGRIETHVV
jgi:hypothetical protein